MTAPEQTPHTLFGRYSDSHDLLIEGTQSGLLSLVRTIRADRESLDMAIPAAGNPQPYDGFLSRVVAEQAAGKVRIARQGTELHVTGDAAFRALLAENIETLAQGSLDDHLHIDPHPEHYYLDWTTASLVVELLR